MPPKIQTPAEKAREKFKRARLEDSKKNSKKFYTCKKRKF